MLRRYRLSRLANTAIKAAVAQKFTEAQSQRQTSAACSVLALSLRDTPP
jgi:hypothetical protein